MKVTVQVVLHTDDDTDTAAPAVVREVFCLDRDSPVVAPRGG